MTIRDHLNEISQRGGELQLRGYLEAFAKELDTVGESLGWRDIDCVQADLRDLATQMREAAAKDLIAIPQTTQVDARCAAARHEGRLLNQGDTCD